LCLLAGVGSHVLAPCARLPATAVRAPVAACMQPTFDPETYDPEKGGIGIAGSPRPDGSHGTGYRFMPLSSLGLEAAPMLVAIAGVLPGLTGTQLLAPQPLPFPEMGKWNYHRLIADGLPTGFVALPGSELLLTRPNTVAVVCPSPLLGIELADDKEHEVLALIDRGDPAVHDLSELSPQDFYAFADDEDRVHIRWLEALPAGWRVLGRLVYTQLPYVEKPGSKSGFAEMSDDFDF